ncbi:PleD family two-component system response regulator [Candidatus Omnitrophota bacterium]
MKEKKRILFVDDDEEVLDGISSLLERNNYEVVLTSDPNEVLKLSRHLKPDLIILDILMPDIDGGTLAAMLREDRVTNKIPVIFLTGLITKTEESKALIDSLQYKVLAKPCTRRELLGAIGEAISG